MNHPLIGLVLSVSAISGCARSLTMTTASKEQTPGDPEIVEVSIFHVSTGWHLNIRPDGSGLVGYGSSGSDFAPFDQHTFDFAAVRDRLLALSVAERGNTSDIPVAFHQAGVTSTRCRYVSDEETVNLLFVKAIERANKAGTRVDQLLRTRPVLRHDEPHKPMP